MQLFASFSTASLALCVQSSNMCLNHPNTVVYAEPPHGVVTYCLSPVPQELASSLAGQHHLLPGWGEQVLLLTVIPFLPPEMSGLKWSRILGVSVLCPAPEAWAQGLCRSHTADRLLYPHMLTVPFYPFHSPPPPCSENSGTVDGSVSSGSFSASLDLAFHDHGLPCWGVDSELPLNLLCNQDWVLLVPSPFPNLTSLQPAIPGPLDALCSPWPLLSRSPHLSTPTPSSWPCTAEMLVFCSVLVRLHCFIVGKAQAGGTLVMVPSNSTKWLIPFVCQHLKVVGRHTGCVTQCQWVRKVPPIKAWSSHIFISLRCV